MEGELGRLAAVAQRKAAKCSDLEERLTNRLRWGITVLQAKNEVMVKHQTLSWWRCGCSVRSAHHAPPPLSLSLTHTHTHRELSQGTVGRDGQWQLDRGTLFVALCNCEQLWIGIPEAPLPCEGRSRGGGELGEGDASARAGAVASVRHRICPSASAMQEGRGRPAALLPHGGQGAGEGLAAQAGDGFRHVGAVRAVPQRRPASHDAGTPLTALSASWEAAS
jgi:hypothetical protein